MHPDGAIGRRETRCPPSETAPNLGETKRQTVPYFDAIKSDFKNAIRTAMAQPDELLFGEETFTDAL